MYTEFQRVCAALNGIGIRPLLYGSLGLERVCGESLNPQDIDMLVPEIFLGGKWDALKQTAALLGYELYDQHEHAFRNGRFSVAFASIEELERFAGIRVGQIGVVSDMSCTYMLLNLTQYLQVYRRSAADGYRRTKNHGKDDGKIKMLERLIADET